MYRKLDIINEHRLFNGVQSGLVKAVFDGKQYIIKESEYQIKRTIFQ